MQASKRGAKQKGSASAPMLSQAAVSSVLDLTQEDEAEARRQAEVRSFGYVADEDAPLALQSLIWSRKDV